jgi:hypothetical protein
MNNHYKIFLIAVTSCLRLSDAFAQVNSTKSAFYSGTSTNDGSAILLHGLDTSARKNAGALEFISYAANRRYEENAFVFTTYTGEKKLIPQMVMNKWGQLIIGDYLIENNLVTPAGTDYKLFVKDGILTEKLKVANSEDYINWSDFVFDNDYKLMSLGNLESYIKRNKHLPEIPTAKEVAKDGIDVAAMDAKLLQKIEELTLYVIELKKEMETMKLELKHK